VPVEYMPFYFYVQKSRIIDGRIVHPSLEKALVEEIVCKRDLLKI
jgi:hypothetical protein